MRGGKTSVSSRRTQAPIDFMGMMDTPSLKATPRATPRATQQTRNYYIKDPLFPEKEKGVLIVPSRFEANTEFTYLSHSINIGENKDKYGNPINPKNPPEYIKYDMLLREVGVFLEDEFNTEEELQRQFKKASDKEKEALKSRLWGIWYNIMVDGSNEEAELLYNNETSVRTITTKHLLKQSRKKTGKSASAASGARIARRHSIGGVGTPRSLNLTPEEQVYGEFLFQEMKKYIDGADKTRKDSYGYTDYDYEKDYFNFATKHATDVIKKAYDIKIRLREKIYENNISISDIFRGFDPSKFPYPDPLGFNSIYQPNNKLYLFGMQLPHQFNRELLFNTMVYLFHMKIYNLADLQGCADAINRQNHRMNIGIGCNPYDRECEPLMWDIAKRYTLDEYQSKNNKGDEPLTPRELDHLKKGLYYDIKIKDMTAGYLWSWNEISKIKDTSKSENSIVVHCLAGAGRTGCAMLYLLLRDTRNYLDSEQKKAYEAEIKDRLANPHFGFNNIAEVIGMFRAYFINYNTNTEATTGELFKLSSKIMDKKTEDLLKQKGVPITIIRKILNRGMDTTTEGLLSSTYFIDDAIIKAIKKLQVKSQATTTLLRQRLNRVFFFLAKEFKVKEFYTYGRATTQVFFLPDDEFSNPIKRKISDWSTYDRTATSREEVREWLK
jgi:protein-tyrosine phosphatase